MMKVGSEELFIVFLFLGLFIFWIWSLVDVLKSKFSGYNKIIWVLLVIFLGALGSILYLFIGRKQKVSKNSLSG